MEKNKELYARVEKLSQEHNCTPAQLALAWVLHQGEDVVPIPGKDDIHMLNLDAEVICDYFLFEALPSEIILIHNSIVCQEQLR